MASSSQQQQKFDIAKTSASIWNAVTGPLQPLEPVYTNASNIWQRIFDPVWSTVGRTKWLDSMLGTIALGLIILGLTLLSIRLSVIV